jgi:hypothetical protein
VGTQAGHDAVVERMHRIPGRGGALVQGVQQRLVKSGIQRFYLYPDIPIADGFQGLEEERHRLAVGQVVGPDGCRGQLRDRPQSGQDGIVVYHELAVLGCVDVQLDPVSPERNRAPEGGQTVLGLVSGCPPVGDD